MTSLILAGLGIAATALTARYILRNVKQLKNTVEQAQKSQLLSTYYRGGFEKNMTRREAGLILGVSPASSAEKISKAHKRIMGLNHPDQGGSPYLAHKIGEAKEYLDKKTF